MIHSALAATPRYNLRGENFFNRGADHGVADGRWFMASTIA